MSLIIVPGEETVWLGTERLPITGRAFTLLSALAERAGEVISVQSLLKRVWPEQTVDAANLRNNISILRQVLGDVILNVPGRGYMLALPVTVSHHHANDFQLSRTPARRPGQIFGRAEDIDKAAAQLRASRFVTITGPGGVGKTVLAHALMQQAASAVMIDLADTMVGKSLVPELAVALGLRRDAGYDETETRLRAAHGLLVLDNCDRVAKHAAALAGLLRNDVPELAIVATSRQRLAIAGETVFALSPLAIPDSADKSNVFEWRSAPVVALFLDRLAANGGDSEVSNRELDMVINICRKLDGLPLAIEFVADLAAAHGLETAHGLLGDPFAVLTRGRRTAPVRHRTLRAAIAWSHDLLDADERILFRRLAVLPDGFDAGSVHEAGLDRAFSGKLSSMLEGLAAKSLLVTIDGPGRQKYRLLETIRAFAAEKLREAGEPSVPGGRSLYNSPTLVHGLQR